MASGNVTRATANVHIGEVWPVEIIKAAKFELLIQPRVRTVNFPKGQVGDVIHIPRLPNFEVLTKADNTAWNPLTYTDTEQLITIDTWQVTGFLLEDPVTVLSNTATQQTYTEQLGYALGRAVDVKLAEHAQSFSTSVGTLGGVTTWSHITEAYRSMIAWGNDMSKCTWFFSAEAQAAMLQQDVFINALYGGNGRSESAITRGQIGMLLGAPFVVSLLLRQPAAGQHENFIVHRDGLAIAMPIKPKIVSEYEVEYLGMRVGAHQLYGTAEINRYSETPGNLTATDNMHVLINGL